MYINLRAIDVITYIFDRYNNNNNNNNNNNFIETRFQDTIGKIIK